METSRLPDFSDKVVSLFQLNRPHEVILQNPIFVDIQDKLFLVGVIPDGGSENDWLSGLECYVLWDEVQECVVFDSIEEYLSRLSMGMGRRQLQ